MTPEAQRIAVAQSLGMTDVAEDTIEHVDFDARSVSVMTYLMGTLPSGKRVAVPRYTEDLNAIQGAVASQDDGFQEWFNTWLHYDAERSRRFAHQLSAADWCETYLKILNLWNET